jgi:hypothetical protein
VGKFYKHAKTDGISSLIFFLFNKASGYYLKLHGATKEFIGKSIIPITI